MPPLALPPGLKRLGPALIALLLVLIGIVSRPLIPIDETRYLTVAWEMRHADTWLYSHLNGANYSDKPPVLFWLINLVWSVTGPNEFAGRLTPALFLPVTVFLTGVLGRRLGGEAVGARAGYVAVGTVAFATFSSLVMFDALLTTAALCGIIGLVDAARGKRLRGFVMVGLALGIGALIKGLPILIHVLPIALLAPFWAPRPQRWTVWYAGILGAVAIGLVIGLGWAFWAQTAGGPPLRSLMVDQTAKRMVGAFTHGRPWWFFIALAPALLFPWWLSRNFWRGVFRRDPATDERRIFRLCWIGAAATFLIFSFISSKQIHYVLPAVPLLAIGLAGLTCPAEQKAEVLFAPAMVLAGLVALALHFLPQTVGAPVSLWCGAIVLTGASFSWLFRDRLGWSGLATGISLFLAVHFAAATGTLTDQDSSWAAARLRERTGAPMAVIGSYEGEFGYAARLTKPIEKIEVSQAATWRAAHPDGVVIEIARKAPLGGPYNEARPYRGGTLALWLPGVSALAATATAASDN